VSQRARREIARVVATRSGVRAELLVGDERRRPPPLELPGTAPPAGSIVEVALRRRRGARRWAVEAWEQLARHDEPRAALYELLGRYGIDPFYPPEVEDEVQAILASPGVDDSDLVDLTHLAFVTIDNEDSRDLDQAIHIESRGEGQGWVLRFALADASYYVRPGSALFAEALRRGVSFYLPTMVVPMLPPALSEGLISLNEGVDRRSLVFVMTLDGDGRCVDTQIVRARIRSRAKLTYDGVQAHHDAPSKSPLRDQPYTATLDLLRAVGERRLAMARERDVVHYTRLNTVVSIEEGRFRLVEETRNDVSRWNEQVSLLCNMEGAAFLNTCTEPRPDVQPIYRVHEAPSSEALDRLSRTIERLVALHDLDPAQWCWRRTGPDAKSLGDYLDGLDKLDKKTSEPAAERVKLAIERQALVVNHRSLFTSEPGRHFALGVTPYSRFSSPMREVVGVFTHKEALEKLRLVEPACDEDDEELRARIIDAANSARERQQRLDKALNELAVDDLFADELDRDPAERIRYTGTILGVKATRLYVQLDDPPAEVKVYTVHLEADLGEPLAMDHDELTLGTADGKARFSVGEAITLSCHGYDKARRRWDLRPA